MEGVSVVLCCYNSELRLPKTLEHLAAQRTPQNFSWEIILVDNASTDNTRAVALSLWKKMKTDPGKLKIVDQPVQGLSHARARGVEASVYDVIIFCDDDNWLAENYLFDAWSVMNSDSRIGALGGTGTAVADVDLPAWFEDYKGCYACYPQGDHEGEIKKQSAFLYGAGMVVRRKALAGLTSKGFIPILSDRTGNNLTSGGDVELSYALRLTGYKLWFSEKLQFRHYLPAARLTEDYLRRLISSMSYCSGLLVMYHYALDEKKVSRSAWFKDSVYQAMFFGKAIFKYLLSKDSSMTRELNFIFSYNKMKSILHQFGTYRSRYDRIIGLKEGSHEN